jgi:zinc transport system substrate-binding protein
VSDPPPLIRVEPPSASGEGGLVLRAAIAVVLAALFVISSRRQARLAGEIPLLPYQQKFVDLPSPLQRDYRELREGYEEAARARAKAGAWPEPEKLAADGVPPFAIDGVEGRLREWRVVRDGRVALYFGVARAEEKARPNLLLRVIESAPADFESRDPNTRIDEEHRRLADGTLVHVTTWYRDPAAGPVAVDGSLRPEMSGWTQMVGRAAVRSFADTLPVTLPVPRAARPAAPGVPPPAKLAVGVTLHPYYSWVANLVKGTDVEVRSILPGEIDAGNYQPRAEDIRKLADLDAIVINGVGHDDFILDMLKASGNARIVVIQPNDEVALLRAKSGNAVNSHTFISFTNAIQQTYAIAKALADLRPDLAAKFDENAGEYARRLRRIKAAAATRLAGAAIRKVITVHDGYGYLLQEFGIDIDAVIEPAHGLVPSGAELKDVIDILRRDQIAVVFSEESFPKPLLDVVREQGHARVYLISHIASGEYTADKFEREMQANVDVMVKALVTDPEVAGK